MIENNFETTPINHRLFPLSGKQVELSFSGDQISSDGGLLLLREVENKLGLIDRICSCITDNKDHRYIGHTIKEMLTQRVFQIAAGYEDCNDCDDLRDDMIFKTCAGRMPQSGQALASQLTMSRLENSIDSKDLYRMGQQLMDTFISSYAREPEVINLDCDDTNNNTGFITGLSGHKKLHELASVTIKSAKREFKQYGKFVKRYHSFLYKAGSWSKPQKVVVKVEVSEQGINIRYIVTNLIEFKAKALYEKGYCARCAMELRIKEHKLYMRSDRSSCTNFNANQFRLFLHSMAYILLHIFQKETLRGTEFANATFDPYGFSSHGS